MAQRKRRINRKKQIKRLSFLAGILILIIVLFVTNFTRLRLWIKGYGISEQNILLSLTDEQIKEYLENDPIDLSMWDEIDNDHHYLDYVQYESKTSASTEDTISYVDAYYEMEESLEALGFDLKTGRKLMGNLSIADFKEIVSNSYNYDQIKQYLEIKGCVIQDIQGYLNSGLDAMDAVLSVSYPFIDSQYAVTRNYLIEEPDNYLVLIKSGFQLDASYEPNDLVISNIELAPDHTNNKLRKAANEALETMASDAKKEGYELLINSAYRSYSEQESVYNEYFTIYDAATAASLVAVPGSSEHQLGLSVDLTCQSVVDGVYGVFGDSPDYSWTVEHAHEYGFILRYPEDKTNLTGTANEPWHYRYVGIDAATEIYDKNWTLEEYILNHGFSYSLSF